MKITVYESEVLIEEISLDITLYPESSPYEFTYKEVPYFKLYYSNDEIFLLPIVSDLSFNRNLCKEQEKISNYDKIFYKNLSVLFTDINFQFFFDQAKELSLFDSSKEDQTKLIKNYTNPFFEDKTQSTLLQKPSEEQQNPVQEDNPFFSLDNPPTALHEKKINETFESSSQNEESFQEPPLENPIESNFQESSFQSPQDSFFSSESQKTKQVSINQANDDSTRIDNFFTLFRLKLFGEYIPFDYYILSKEEIFIGRDPSCEISISDPEISKKHARIIKTYEGYQVEDLNSSNGIIHEGQITNKVLLSSGTEFILGSTTFKLEIKSSFVKEEESILMPVESDLKENIAPEKTSSKKIPPIRIALFIFLGIFLVQLMRPKKEPTKIVEKTTESSTKKYSPEEENFLTSNYELAKHYLKEGLLAEAKEKIDLIKNIDPQYKKTQVMETTLNERLRKLQELELRRKKEQEQLLIRELVLELNSRLKTALENNDLIAVEILVQEVLSQDPENLYALEAKSILAEKKRLEEEERLRLEAQEKLKQELLELLIPAQLALARGDYYFAVNSLNETLEKTIVINEVYEQATSLLKEASTRLEEAKGPLLEEARIALQEKSFKEAYSLYEKVLKLDPALVEALVALDQIKSFLEEQNRKFFQEGVFLESYGYLTESKESFKQVLDSSPNSSPYSQKANVRLSYYLD